jgi:predicted nucleic acid-binding Zn ribbon protein
MPIYVYQCPEGHETEELIRDKRDKEPKFCKHMVTHLQKLSGKYETFECGLPLKKVISPAPMQWVKGKNPNWPL